MDMLDNFINRFQLILPIATGTAQPVNTDSAKKSAAVLLPIICKPEPTLLFTKRTDNLRLHASQISFPGGAREPDDHNLIETALRESCEEINILPNQVQILGKMQPIKSHSGYLVTPIVGLLSAKVSYYKNPAEVAAIFEVPLKHALTLTHHHSIMINNAGHKKRLFFYHYNQYLIWGLTATILNKLALQLV
ncbi:CoA pyrophosphatase [Arsenophonus sp. ENCA]|uniref:CoA pyrophosphatase n=1 Tax=Arsenophonus sp. ENCA TaxID=1987579 RepID=UPI000BD61335|nr:CoA pyrophosphatase [Arsenophonus sp. ENCA]PAV01732.1 CoA pyrophosphatase [Arsenophonus sp. ENCA]